MLKALTRVRYQGGARAMENRDIAIITAQDILLDSFLIPTGTTSKSSTEN